MMSITELDHLGQLWIIVAHILIINVGILLLLFFVCTFVRLFVCLFFSRRRKPFDRHQVFNFKFIKIVIGF